jgi:hypothetical protein
MGSVPRVLCAILGPNQNASPLVRPWLPCCLEYLIPPTGSYNPYNPLFTGLSEDENLG